MTSLLIGRFVWLYKGALPALCPGSEGGLTNCSVQNRLPVCFWVACTLLCNSCHNRRFDTNIVAEKNTVMIYTLSLVSPVLVVFRLHQVHRLHWFPGIAIFIARLLKFCIYLPWWAISLAETLWLRLGKAVGIYHLNMIVCQRLRGRWSGRKRKLGPFPFCWR